MDQRDGYASARELALTGLHREAREALKALLVCDPSHVDALILPGKVEHYLGHSASSCQCFEIVLSYDADNMAAFFGIEYYRQRRRSVVHIACMAILIAAIAAATALLSHRMTSSFRELDARLEGVSTALSLPVERTRNRVEEIGEAALEERKHIEKALSEIRAEFVQLRKANAALMRETEELRKTSLPGSDRK